VSARSTSALSDLGLETFPVEKSVPHGHTFNSAGIECCGQRGPTSGSVGGADRLGKPLAKTWKVFVSVSVGHCRTLPAGLGARNSIEPSALRPFGNGRVGPSGADGLRVRAEDDRVGGAGRKATTYILAIAAGRFPRASRPSGGGRTSPGPPEVGRERGTVGVGFSASAPPLSPSTRRRSRAGA